MMFSEYKEQIQNGNFKENWLVLGMDISDSNIYLSIFNNKSKKVEPIDLSNGFGKISISSFVQFREESNEWIIGQEAYRTIESYKESTIDTALTNIQEEVKVKLGDEFYFPEFICAKIFQYVINKVLERLPNSEVVGITVSVPNDFSNIHKEKIKETFNLIGYKDKVISVISKRRANLLTYSNQFNIDDENLLSFDFGSKNLDISLIAFKNEDNISNGLIIKSETFTNHGGNNIDNILLDKFYSYIEDNDIDVNSLTALNISELKIKATETKERFSGVDKVRIPFTFCVPPFMKQLEMNEFLELIDKFIIKTRKHIESITKNENIAKVFVSGGSSNMKWVKDILDKSFSDNEKIIITEKPELNTVIGACIHSCISLGLINIKDIVLTKQNDFIESDILYDIGVVIEEKFYPIINKGASTFVCKKSRTFNLDFSDKSNSIELTFFKRFNKNDKIKQLEKIAVFNFSDIIEDKEDNTIKISLNITDNSKTVHGKIYLLGKAENFDFKL